MITISNRREELLKTFLGVARSANHLGIEGVEYVVVEVGDEVTEPLPNVRNIKVKHIVVKRGGFSLQRNIGVSESESRLLVFIDDGMEIPECWMEHITAPILKGEAEAVFGGVLPRPEMLKDIIVLSQAILGFPAGGMRFMAEGRRYVESFSTSNLAILKELVLEAGMFDERLIFGAEDSDLSIRVKRVRPDTRILFEPRALVFTEPRRSLNELRRWFVRRGKSFATIARKYERNPLMRVFRRELLLPKLFLASMIPPVLPLFLVAYLKRVREIIRTASESDYFPREQRTKTELLLPILKLYIDFWYSVGYYSEILKPHMKDLI